MAEMLFLRGVDPWRSVGSVDDLAALVELGHRLLDANKERPGHVTTGDTTAGAGELGVRAGGQAVPAVRDGDQAGRGRAAGAGTARFWCPNCQR